MCNRSFFPCFDTPAVKSTYSATVRVSWTGPYLNELEANLPQPGNNTSLDSLSAHLQVPDGVTVLMSASRSSYSKLDRVFQFSMEFPVPSYLVALVAGDLQHVDVGPRSVPGSACWVGLSCPVPIYAPGSWSVPGPVPCSGSQSGSQFWIHIWFLFTDSWFSLKEQNSMGHIWPPGFVCP